MSVLRVDRVRVTSKCCSHARMHCMCVIDGATQVLHLDGIVSSLVCHAKDCMGTILLAVGEYVIGLELTYVHTRIWTLQGHYLGIRWDRFYVSVWLHLSSIRSSWEISTLGSVKYIVEIKILDEFIQYAVRRGSVGIPLVVTPRTEHSGTDRALHNTVREEIERQYRDNDYTIWTYLEINLLHCITRSMVSSFIIEELKSSAKPDVLGLVRANVPHLALSFWTSSSPVWTATPNEVDTQPFDTRTPSPWPVCGNLLRAGKWMAY